MPPLIAIAPGNVLWDTKEIYLGIEKSLKEIMYVEYRESFTPDFIRKVIAEREPLLLPSIENHVVSALLAFDHHISWCISKNNPDYYNPTCFSYSSEHEFDIRTMVNRHYRNKPVKLEKEVEQTLKVLKDLATLVLVSVGNVEDNIRKLNEANLSEYFSGYIDITSYDNISDPLKEFHSSYNHTKSGKVKKTTLVTASRLDIDVLIGNFSSYVVIGDEPVSPSKMTVLPSFNSILPHVLSVINDDS